VRPPAPVAIVGAGPYGLSLASHLRGLGVPFRIFGAAMDSWARQMPEGMLLKSEGFASSLSDPQRRSTLGRFCAAHGLQYGDIGVPIPLETIVAYGRWFQREQAPELEDKRVEALEPHPEGFHVRLNDREAFVARRVVLAVGTAPFRHVPEGLSRLPSALVSHSSFHHDLSFLRGRAVAVVGAGASAIDLTALLHANGAEVELIARRPSLHFHSKGRERTPWRRVRHPLSGIGPGWRNVFYADAPMAFRHLPQSTRVRIARTHLGPAAAPWMRELIVGRVPLHLGCTSISAAEQGGRVRLELQTAGGESEGRTFDHVIAATGYRVDVQRLEFVHPSIRSGIRTVGGFPLLSAGFESTVAGLHFLGLASALDFGPSMRFICGADYTARAVSHRLSQAVERLGRAA
jgi:hypothetical protein